ncbi:hypothetical protein DFH09DRAFT_1073324 [Mycena vulgaris]|nr:hypothetical protein DFH09DRAFT_1073324 [Mycena vulgaris]
MPDELSEGEYKRREEIRKKYVGTEQDADYDRGICSGRQFFREKLPAFHDGDFLSLDEAISALSGSSWIGMLRGKSGVLRKATDDKLPHACDAANTIHLESYPSRAGHRTRRQPWWENRGVPSAPTIAIPTDPEKNLGWARPRSSLTPEATTMYFPVWPRPRALAEAVEWAQLEAAALAARRDHRADATLTRHGGRGRGVRGRDLQASTATRKRTHAQGALRVQDHHRLRGAIHSRTRHAAPLRLLADVLTRRTVLPADVHFINAAFSAIDKAEFLDKLVAGLTAPVGAPPPRFFKADDVLEGCLDVDSNNMWDRDPPAAEDPAPTPAPVRERAAPLLLRTLRVLSALSGPSPLVAALTPQLAALALDLPATQAKEAEADAELSAASPPPTRTSARDALRRGDLGGAHHGRQGTDIGAAALRCFGALPARIPHAALQLCKAVLLRGLADALDDPTRGVRSEAVDAREICPTVDTLEVLANSFKTPFLGPISNIAKSLLTAVQSVRKNKNDCTQLLEQTYGLLCMIISLHMALKTGSDLESPSMLNHLGKFTDTLYKINTFVEAQQDKSKIRRFFRQGEMSKLLKDCNLGLQEALDHFKLQDINLLSEVVVMQKFAEDRHKEILELIEAFSDGTASDKGSLVQREVTFVQTNRVLSSSYNSSTSISMLPSEPKIFHGRESELSDILKLFMQESPRIAILGAGGMGKTSLAKAVLHHPTVTGKYGQHRFFVACDSTSSKDELVILIGAHLGLKSQKNLAKVILHHFTTNPACLLILDNLETLWESTEICRDIEEFLSLLTEVKHLALIITMRGTERPASVHWTRPFLPALKPLTQAAARQTFIDIADDGHDNDDIDKVLLLTGNMPLAIDLIAHLVDSEGCSQVLARWEEEKTSVISDGYDTRSNLDLSISMSLSSPRITSVPHCQDLLSVLSMLPDGLSDIELVQSKLPIKDILSCKAALLSTSLAYSDDQRRFKVLVPIREYMARSYPPMDYLVQALLNYFHQLLELEYKYYGTVSASEMTLKITLNFSNIHSLLLNMLQHQNSAAADTIYCVIYFNAFSRLAGRGRTPLMDHIAHIQPLPSGLEVFLITEIFSSWRHHPIPNPAALIEQAINQLPHFDESNVKCSTGRFYNTLGNYYLHRNNDIPTATNYYQSGLSLAISTGNTRRQCQSSVNLAFINWHMGNPTAGQRYASEAQRLAKIPTDLYTEAQALRIEAMCWHAHGNYKYAASLCNRAQDLLAHCGMSGSAMDSEIMNTQAEVHKLKSEYVEARNIQTKILHERPIELVPLEHAFSLLNMAELDVLLGAPTERVQRTIDTARSIFNSVSYVVYEMLCDAAMGALHLREGNLQSATSFFHRCLSSSWVNYAELVNYCLERLGDRSLWDSTDQSWTIIYLVHASKSQQKLDIHKALQFLGDVFRAEGDQDTAVSLLTVALEGFSQMDVHRSRAECMLLLGYISKENGDMLKAAELWKTARPLFERSSQVKKSDPH